MLKSYKVTTKTSNDNETITLDNPCGVYLPNDTLNFTYKGPSSVVLTYGNTEETISIKEGKGSFTMPQRDVTLQTIPVTVAFIGPPRKSGINK